MQQARHDNQYRQQYPQAAHHGQFHPSRPGVGNRKHKKENHRENEHAVKQVHGDPSVGTTMKAAANRVCGGDHAGDAAFWRVKYRFENQAEAKRD
jgi:hypothetical protein